MIAYNINFVKSIGGGRILILGFGREGRDTFLFLRKLFPRKILGIADKNEGLKSLILNLKSLSGRKISLHLGKDYLRILSRYDVIIKSPGIPPKLIAPYVKKQQKIISATEIFLENCSGTIIGVTGTKGKSTTSAMIYHILKNHLSKKNYRINSKIYSRIYLVGNIGKPALSLLARAKPEDIFVYEMSSHQLYGLKKSPHIAIFLNIYPEHLDYYRNFQEYARAKANICLWQGNDDYLVYNTGDKLVAKFAKKSKAKKIPIRGEYYELDKAAALAVAKILKIPKQSAVAALNTFHYLPHRLERVGVFRGITFYNDSLATIPQATIEALDFLGNRVETLIAGGFDRGVKFDGLAKKIIKSDITTLILFPSSGKRILKTIKDITNYKLQITKKSQTTNKSQITNYKPQPIYIWAGPRPSSKGRWFQTSKKQVAFFPVSNMEEAVKIAFERTQRGKICLLSPASPSFGLFKDYKDRGEQFKHYIKRLA